MTKASLKAKYETATEAASTTVAVNVGDVKFKATCTDKTFENGPKLTGVSVGAEKPGFFIIDYDLPNKAARFQFMSMAKLLGKQVKLTYIHPQKANATLLEGTLAFNPENKVTGRYSFLSGKSSVKYSYSHGSNLCLEPSYDFSREAWNFAVSQKFAGENTLKATYESSQKILGLEWTRESKETGFFKVGATVHTDDTKPPKLSLERTWNFEI